MTVIRRAMTGKLHCHVADAVKLAPVGSRPAMKCAGFYSLLTGFNVRKNAMRSVRSEFVIFSYQSNAISGTS